MALYAFARAIKRELHYLYIIHTHQCVATNVVLKRKLNIKCTSNSDVHMYTVHCTLYTENMDDIAHRSPPRYDLTPLNHR